MNPHQPPRIGSLQGRDISSHKAEYLGPAYCITDSSSLFVFSSDRFGEPLTGQSRSNFEKALSLKPLESLLNYLSVEGGRQNIPLLLGPHLVHQHAQRLDGLFITGPNNYALIPLEYDLDQGKAILRETDQPTPLNADSVRTTFNKTSVHDFYQCLLWNLVLELEVHSVSGRLSKEDVEPYLESLHTSLSEHHFPSEKLFIPSFSEHSSEEGTLIRNARRKYDHLRFQYHRLEQKDFSKKDLSMGAQGGIPYEYHEYEPEIPSKEEPSPAPILRQSPRAGPRMAYQQRKK
ncbi:MAG TPA: hypothetical protein VJB08_03620 [Candidatus Nanoarchaeia archaeon]|nr:hypothetical protein [Candidatus Nanoarchaeia archaeon]